MHFYLTTYSFVLRRISFNKDSDVLCWEPTEKFFFVVIMQIYFFINNSNSKPQTKLGGKLCTFVWQRTVIVKTYKKGILAWYDCHLSTVKVEGINNKIKVMKRNAYGFRDEKYFTLRLYALHDCRITRNVGWTIFIPSLGITAISTLINLSCSIVS